MLDKLALLRISHFGGSLKFSWIEDGGEGALVLSSSKFIRNRDMPLLLVSYSLT
jgi:hypothetical protein